MNIQSARTRQPARTAWSNEHLLRKRALALGHSKKNYTAITYPSHLQSYLTFFQLHNHPICLTIDTLSFYVVFMSHHINPKSVGTYLSGICNTLEPHFPHIRKIRLDPLVVQTLSGMKKLRGGHAPCHHHPLTKEDLILLLARYDTDNYDD